MENKNTFNIKEYIEGRMSKIEAKYINDEKTIIQSEWPFFGTSLISSGKIKHKKAL